MFSGRITTSADEVHVTVLELMYDGSMTKTYMIEIGTSDLSINTASADSEKSSYNWHVRRTVSARSRGIQCLLHRGI